MAGGHGDGRSQLHRHGALSVAVVTPGADGAVGQQRHRVEGAGGHALDRGQAVRGAELPQGVGAPAPELSGGVEGIAVDEAPGDGDRIGQFGRIGAHFAPPGDEVPGRPRELPHRTDSQDIDARSLGFPLDAAFQLGLEGVAARVGAFDAEEHQGRIRLARQSPAIAIPLVGGVVGHHLLVGRVGRIAPLGRRIIRDDGDVGLQREGLQRQRTQSQQVAAEELAIPVGGQEQGHAGLVARQCIGRELRQVVGSVAVGVGHEGVAAEAQFLNVAETVTIGVGFRKRLGPRRQRGIRSEGAENDAEGSGQPQQPERRGKQAMQQREAHGRLWQ